MTRWLVTVAPAAVLTLGTSARAAAGSSGAPPRAPRRLRLARAATYLATLCLLASMCATAAHADGTQPGKTDPMGGPAHYTTFRSDDLFTMLPKDQSHTTFSSYSPSADLSSLPPSDGTTSHPTNYSQSQVGASGRILSPERDQVAIARPDGNGNIEVSLLQRGNGVGGSASDYNLPHAAPWSAGGTYPLRVAVGDLDGITDSQGQRHDEVVVAYPQPNNNGSKNVTVSVLDYTNSSEDNAQPTAMVTTTLTGLPLCDANSSCSTTHFDNELGMAIGDFDGNGQNEVAVVYRANDLDLRMAIFRYTNDGQGHRSLTQASARDILLDPAGSGGDLLAYPGALDVAAGDFNGDGKDELAVAAVEWNHDNPGVYGIWIKTFRGDSNLNMTLASNNPVVGDTSFNPSDPVAQPRVQLVAGLFKFDQGNGFGLNRRQLALAYNPPNPTYGAPVVKTFVADTNLVLSPLYPDFALPHVNSSGKLFSLAAGGFKGNADMKNDVLWPLAYAVLGNYNVYTVGVIDVGAGGLSATGAYQQPPAMQWDARGTARPVVVPYDMTGKALYLGAPVHITLQNLLNTDYALYEPPKETYYDETLKRVVTVSRWDGFNVDLTNEQGLDFKNSSTDTTNWTVGASAAASAGAGYKLGGDFGLIKAGASACVQVTAKASYDYNNSTASDTSVYNTRTVGVQGTTNEDDYVQGRYQNIDVWRYRVYGSKDTQTNPYTYYDLMLPGTYQTFKGGGLNQDWWQPVHENGNVLSYPRRLGSNGSDTPADLGSFTLPNGTVKTEPMISGDQLAYDGTGGAEWLKWTTDVASGASTEYKHTINASLDVKAAVKAEASGPLEGVSVNGSLDLNAHGGTNWGNATITDNHTNGSTEIKLNKPVGGFPPSGNASYDFSPVFYTAKDGTVKVAYSVDLTGSNAGKTWWQAHFGGRPDPALNLPNRYLATFSEANGVQNGWAPNPMWSQRKLIRGFSLTSPTTSAPSPNPDPITGDYPQLPDAPHTGDKVRVAVRVYNYSLDTPAPNVRVRFQAVKYDGSTLRESGPRVDIGDTTVNLGDVNNGTQMTTAAITWDTTDLGPSTPGTSQQYRIYVVLNPKYMPDGTTPNPSYIPNEIYPAEPAPVGWQPGDNNDAQPFESDGLTPKGWDPGQNDEGFGLATVAAKPAPGAPRPGRPADVRMTGDALAALGPHGQLRTRLARATVGQPLQLRAKVSTDQAGTGYTDVLFYDGDPDKGGAQIADKQAFAGDPAGGYVWATWTPTTPGAHQIYARALAGPDDANPGNNVDSLRVVVGAARGRAAATSGAPDQTASTGTAAGTATAKDAVVVPSAGAVARPASLGASAGPAAPRAALANDDGADCGSGSSGGATAAPPPSGGQPGGSPPPAPGASTPERDSGMLLMPGLGAALALGLARRRRAAARHKRHVHAG